LIKPIEIPLRASRRLVMILAVAHLLALAISWTVPLHWTMRAGLSAMVASSAVLTYRRLRNADIDAIRVNIKGEFSVRSSGGEWLAASVLGSSFVAPYLTLLHLELEDRPGRRYVLLLPDALAADDFRRLRVWLKWRS
jgi:toxin CptA